MRRYAFFTVGIRPLARVDEVCKLKREHIDQTFTTMCIGTVEMERAVPGKNGQKVQTRKVLVKAAYINPLELVLTLVGELIIGGRYIEAPTKCPFNIKKQCVSMAVLACKMDNGSSSMKGIITRKNVKNPQGQEHGRICIE